MRMCGTVPVTEHATVEKHGPGAFVSIEWPLESVPYRRTHTDSGPCLRRPPDCTAGDQDRAAGQRFVSVTPDGRHAAAGHRLAVPLRFLNRVDRAPRVEIPLRGPRFDTARIPRVREDIIRDWVVGPAL